MISGRIKIRMHKRRTYLQINKTVNRNASVEFQGEIMSNIRKFLTPDYFPDFHCKMGACRAACCEGWPISVSLTDYFRLLGAECSSELKRKLDCALHISEHPSPEGYAHILPRYDGQCPMRLADGRCGLQVELGEAALATVCRLYPRGVRTGDVHECSCANSCEAVVELLLHRPEAMRFVEMALDIDVPEAPARRFHFENAGREQEIRLWLMAMLQDRRLSLPQRLHGLGNALAAMNAALAARDHRRVEALLSGRETLPAPEDMLVGEAQLRFGLQVAGRMMEIMDTRSESIRAYGERALHYFGGKDDEAGAFRRYIAARGGLAERIPQWETWFEQLLVNHMFFSQFPFQDRPVDLTDEYVGLCAVYILLRFLLVGCMADRAQDDGATELAVDVVTAAFRLIDHTEFDRYAAPMLKTLCGEDKLGLLLAL